MTYKFAKEFTEAGKELEKAKKILLVAHSRPDGDTVGSVFVLKEYLENFLGKRADATCADFFPDYLRSIFHKADFVSSASILLADYDLIVGCDAVERGFEKIITEKSKKQKLILFDHHPRLELKKIEPDIVIADEKYSSVCEILYDFFDFHRIDITKKMATYLLTGILGDTGVFQHANTTPRVMEITADLMRKGAPLSKIIQLSFKSKKMETLKLWGRGVGRGGKEKKKRGRIFLINHQGR